MNDLSNLVITSTNPCLLVYMVDQSRSMEDLFGNASHSKSVEVANAINDILYEVGLRCIGTAGEIKNRFDACVDTVIEQVRNTPNNWVWSYHKSPEDLRANREKAISLFLEDYDHGKIAGRYLNAELPKLDFQDKQFQLALCSHFLFLYSEHLSFEFHLDSIRELCRIAEEVRIFPILTLAQARSPYIDEISSTLAKEGISSEIIQVPYELQKGGNQAIIFRS